jgi:hypothetical protein
MHRMSTGAVNSQRHGSFLAYPRPLSASEVSDMTTPYDIQFQNQFSTTTKDYGIAYQTEPIPSLAYYEEHRLT